jgi:hypothetical protein
MKVRALHSFVSPAGAASPGEQLDVSPEQALDWINAGLVERVLPEVETATRSAPEQAVTRKGRR